MIRKSNFRGPNNDMCDDCEEFILNCDCEVTEEPIKKSFFVVSAMRNDSQHLSKNKRLKTEKEAIEHAKSVIGIRSKNGDKYMPFYVLKVTTVVETSTPPIRVKKLK